MEIATTQCSSDRAPAAEAVDSGAIAGRVKPNTMKLGIHNFPA